MKAGYAGDGKDRSAAVIDGDDSGEDNGNCRNGVSFVSVNVGNVIRDDSDPSLLLSSLLLLLLLLFDVGVNDEAIASDGIPSPLLPPPSSSSLGVVDIHSFALQSN
jgi:hypothetical protein